MNSYELKWRNCSRAFGNYETKNGKFCYKLTDDMMFATVGILRFEDGKIEAFLERERGAIFKKKEFRFKNEEDKLQKVELAKKWAEEEMKSILSENLKALMGE